MRKTVVVAGGGICGLSIAWKLLKRRFNVIVLNRGNLQGSAAWASAGMLLPSFSPANMSPSVSQLMYESALMWSDFAQELELTSKLNIEYRTEGTLRIALSESEMHGLRSSYQRNAASRPRVDWLSKSDLAGREPSLSSDICGAIYSANDKQVDSRRVLVALRRAVQLCGGSLLDDAEVCDIVIDEYGARAVKLADRLVRADVVVIATGAWSGLLPKLRVPVRPIKGQILTLRMRRPIWIDHVVWAPNIYLVPRHDGRLLAGATSDDVGFDASIDPRVSNNLRIRAENILPGAFTLELLEECVGFRPYSPDGAPIIGVGHCRGTIVATGLGRDGILLAPKVSDIVADIVAINQAHASRNPFSPLRFDNNSPMLSS
jgi:glycine oxidase